MSCDMSSTRRRFLATAASTVATLHAASWSSLAHSDLPSNRIRIGVIGVGVRGKYLIGNLPDSVRVVAICDCARSQIAGTIAPQEERFSEVLADFVSRDATRCATYQDFRQDRRFAPVTLQYANGPQLQLRPGVKAATLYGERGQMTISRNRFKTDPPDLVQDGPDERVAEKWKGSCFVARPHLENWLECARDRTQPNAPVEVGHRSATVCLLVNLARQLDRPLQWYPQREIFPNDDEAGDLLTRSRRKGWQLPGIG